MNKRFSFYLFFLYLCTLFVPFELLTTTFLSDQSLIFICLLLLIALVYFLLCHFLNHKVISLLTFSGLAIYSVVMLDALKNGFFSIYNNVVKIYKIYTRLNFYTLPVVNAEKIELYQCQALAFLFIFFMMISYSLVFIKKKRGRLFLISLILVFPVLIFQIQFSWFWIGAMLVYWIMLMIPFEKLDVMSFDAFKSVGLIAITVLLTIFPILNRFSEASLREIYDPIRVQQDTLEKFNSFIQTLSRMQKGDEEVSLKNAGNRFYTGAVHLEVQREKKESLYLKEFAASMYENNSWKMLPDDELQMLKSSTFTKSYLWINQYFVKEGSIEKIQITDQRSKNSYSLVPYYLKAIDQPFSAVYDNYVELKDKNILTTYQVYDPKQVEYHDSMNRLYRNFVNVHYKRILSEIYDLFEKQMKLKSKDSFANADEIYEYILSILRNYTYTLSPGNMPNDQDIVSYFLLENKKGYCVHFASAATLMFRYYGIPARYVEGYYISAADLDSDMKAKVIDSDAHAWVEIFDDVLGWVPKEVTVGSTYQHTQQNPDDINQPQLPNNPGNNQNPIIPTRPKDDIDNKPNNQTDHNQNEDSLNHLIYPFIFILILLAYPLYRSLIIVFRKKRFNMDDHQKAAFAMAHYVNQISHYDSSTDEKIKSLLEKNKYSKQGLSDEEFMMLQIKVQEYAKEIYTRLNKRKRFVYKYVKCLI